MIQRTCETCTRGFSVKPYVVRDGLGKYCSHRCQFRGMVAAAAASRPILTQPEDHRLISLGNGSIAKVSIEDFEDLSAQAWNQTGLGYVTNGHSLRMHAFILGKIYGDYSPLVPDHINRDRLDNRRENLRLCTPAQNAQNRRRMKGRPGKLIGVHKSYKKWAAQINVDGVPIYLGTYDAPEDAAYVRDQFAIQLHGDFAVLNFEY